jgi:hypothetical protein
MPKLSNEQMAFFNDCVKNNAKLITVPITEDGSNVACWKFALFGLQNTFKGTKVDIQRPGEYFTAINHLTDVDPNSIWATIPEKLAQYRQQGVNFKDATTNTVNENKGPVFKPWRRNIMQEACEILCNYIGLTDNSSPKPYRLAMQFQDLDTANETLGLEGPNETHFWIEVPLDNGHYVVIQTFPETNQSPDLEFQFDKRDEDKDEFIIYVPINNLLPEHIDIISKAIQLYKEKSVTVS